MILDVDVIFSSSSQIDAVAKSRDGKFRIVSNDEREQTLNQLLTVSFASSPCFSTTTFEQYLYHALVELCIKFAL